MEQNYDMDNFRFLYETRLKKMGLDSNIIMDDLLTKLKSGVDKFDLEPVSKKYPDGSVVDFTVTNLERGKKEENRNQFFLNGPIEVNVVHPDGTSKKLRVPLESQQGPHIDAIKNIADGQTPYLKINTKNGSRDKMYFLDNTRHEDGVRVVAKYGADISAVIKELSKLNLPISTNQKNFLIESLLKGNVHAVKTKDSQGILTELNIQTSRSNDILTRDKEGNTVSLETSGLLASAKKADVSKSEQLSETSLKLAAMAADPDLKNGKGKGKGVGV